LPPIDFFSTLWVVQLTLRVYINSLLQQMLISHNKTATWLGEKGLIEISVQFALPD